MSSITPASFVDDGGSFTKRIPHGLHPKHISNWIDSTSSNTSAYTGSFVDDGADMLIPSKERPGFGKVDPGFYKQRKRKEGKDGVWNDHIQRAVSGDIQRNLAKMRGIAQLEVKKENEETRKVKKKDTVTIPMPPKWGTFIIKAEGGRVIVVDPDGEFDSGPQMPQKSHDGTRWVKATSTIEPPSPTEVSFPASPSRHRTSSHTSKEQSKEHSRDKERKHRSSHKHKKSHDKHLLSLQLKPLTPTPESGYEDGDQPSVIEDIVSPTGFFMTGGAKGWPSRSATSIASPSGSASKYQQSPPASPEKSNSKTKSIVHSPPNGWPCPSQYPVKNATASDQSWRDEDYDEAWKIDEPQRSHASERSRHSHKSAKPHKSHKSHKFDIDNVSTKTYSTYKAPTVEDAPTTSSDSVKSLRGTRWPDSAKSNSIKKWSGSKKSSDRGREESSKGSQSRCIDKQGEYGNGWSASHKNSENNWGGGKKAADDVDWTGHYVASEKQWAGSATGPVRENSWDGFERVKTISEVSVAGSGSERSSLSGHTSSHHPSAHHSHKSGRSRTSRRSGKQPSQTGWEGSQASQESWGSQKARVDDDGWGGGQKKSEYGWEGGKRGSEKSWKEAGGGSVRKYSRYANGYDEDNGTYLNENWGGIPVRVGSRKTSVAGWD